MDRSGQPHLLECAVSSMMITRILSWVKAWRFSRSVKPDKSSFAAKRLSLRQKPYRCSDVEATAAAKV